MFGFECTNVKTRKCDTVRDNIHDNRINTNGEKSSRVLHPGQTKEVKCLRVSERL